MRIVVNHLTRMRAPRICVAGIDSETFVTDVRFYEPDHATIRQAVVADVVERLSRGIDAFLMLGLARAHRVANDDRERHWLQLNGLVLVDRPVGDAP